MNLQAIIPRIFDARHDSESLLQRFWRWWSGEIVYFVPPGIRDAFDRKESIVVVSVRDQEMIVEYRSGSERQRLDEKSLAHLPEAAAAIVELSPAQIVRRQVQLPFGTEDRIADVIGFEMDRLTPFSADDVYFHSRIAGRDTARRVIKVDLILALRKTVDEILERLEQRQIIASKVTLPGAAETTERGLASVNLLPADRTVKAKSRRPLLTTALTALAALLLVVAVTYPFVQQQIQLGRLEKQISELQPAAVAAGETRGAIVEAGRQSNFFADKRNSTPTKIQLLDELTRVVPDDTWLTRIQITGTTVRIQGESEGASSLIGLIEASELLHDARFSSPVTKNPRTSNDRFVVEAQIRVGSEDT